MLVVFFFFKQKTAYEMRISGWSSDVCSSDLSHPLRLRLDDRFRYARQRLEHLVDASGNPVERLMFRAGEAGVDHMVHKIQKRPQIGRASCRERVCQYV